MGKFCAGLCVFAFAFIASADQLIVNGGFEAGGAPWFVQSSAGAPAGGFVNSTAFVTASGYPTVGPASGTHYAQGEAANGPGTYALFQTFTDPLTAISATLSFDMFVNDVFGSTYGTPSGFGQADLLAGSANAITGVPIAVFYNADTFQSDPGTPNPYVHVSLDITADLIPGLTYKIRFLDSSSTGPLDVGVDNVSIITTNLTPTPEPKLAFPIAFLAGIFVCVYRVRRKPQIQE
jgi:hypothetical protein